MNKRTTTSISAVCEKHVEAVSPIRWRIFVVDLRDRERVSEDCRRRNQCRGANSSRARGVPGKRPVAGGSAINVPLANGLVARPYGSGAKHFVDAINVVEGQVGLSPGKYLALSESPFLTQLP